VLAGLEALGVEEGGEGLERLKDVRGARLGQARVVGWVYPSEVTQTASDVAALTPPTEGERPICACSKGRSSTKLPATSPAGGTYFQKAWPVTTLSRRERMR